MDVVFVPLNSTSTSDLDQFVIITLYSGKYGLIVLCSHFFGRRMVRIFAGYTIEQDELVRFLTAQAGGLSLESHNSPLMKPG